MCNPLQIQPFAAEYRDRFMGVGRKFAERSDWGRGNETTASAVDKRVGGTMAKKGKKGRGGELAEYAPKKKQG
jgi:hypothetical protein